MEKQETLYRKVDVKERLPEKIGERYFVENKRGITTLTLMWIDKKKGTKGFYFFHSDSRAELTNDTIYWLEEIPSTPLPIVDISEKDFENIVDSDYIDDGLKEEIYTNSFQLAQQYAQQVTKEKDNKIQELITDFNICLDTIDAKTKEIEQLKSSTASKRIDWDEVKKKWYEYHLIAEQYEELLVWLKKEYPQGIGQGKTDAVEFAEWIINNGFEPFNQVWRASKSIYGEVGDKYTTQELYTLFQSTNK